MYEEDAGLSVEHGGIIGRIFPSMEKIQKTVCYVLTITKKSRLFWPHKYYLNSTSELSEKNYRIQEASLTASPVQIGSMTIIFTSKEFYGASAH